MPAYLEWANAGCGEAKTTAAASTTKQVKRTKRREDIRNFSSMNTATPPEYA
jgi:hypothetical protein